MGNLKRFLDRGLVLASGAAIVLSTGGPQAQAYVGGFKADPAQFPASVRLLIRYSAKNKKGEDSTFTALCSSTKIAPHVFLTAGHCMVEGPLLSLRMTNSAEFANTKEGIAAANPIEVKVKRVEVHPSYLADEERERKFGLHNPDPIDLAVIEIEDDTPYAIAPLAREIPTFRESLLVGGFGVTADLVEPGIESIPGARFTAIEPDGSRNEITQNRHQMRFDVRERRLARRNVFTLIAKKVGLEVTFDADFGLTELPEGSKKSLPQLNAMLRRELPKANNHSQFNHGDSGGAAYKMDAAGKPSEVVGVNSYFRNANRFFDFGRKTPLEYVVRVDQGSEGGRWVQGFVNNSN